jgi:hypothetical protein
MYHFLHICAVEIYLVEAHRQVEGREGKTENVPRDRAELAYLVDIEACIDPKDGAEYVVKDVAAVNLAAVGMYTRLAGEWALWRERKKFEVGIISTSRANIVDMLDVGVIERETSLTSARLLASCSRNVPTH